MQRIADQKRRIVEEVAAELARIGLVPLPCGTAFALVTPPAVQMAEVIFLGSSHASRFHTTTTSFSIELGIFFPFLPRADGSAFSPERLPPLYECHLRTILRRDYMQLAPPGGHSWVHRFRRDIWWVERSGAGLERVVRSVRRVIGRRAPSWLRRFSRPRYVRWYLRWLPGLFPGAPINIGSMGCPYRRHLVAALSQHLDNQPH